MKLEGSFNKINGIQDVLSVHLFSNVRLNEGSFTRVHSVIVLGLGVSLQRPCTLEKCPSFNELLTKIKECR